MTVEPGYLGTMLSGRVPSLREAILYEINPSIAAKVRKRKTTGEAQKDRQQRMTTLQEIIAPMLGHLSVISQAGRSRRDAHKTVITAPLLKSCTGSAPKPIVIAANHRSARAIKMPNSSRVTLPEQYLVVTTKGSHVRK